MAAKWFRTVGRSKRHKKHIHSSRHIHRKSKQHPKHVIKKVSKKPHLKHNSQRIRTKHDSRTSNKAPVNSQETTQNLKKLLHSMYFSKREDELIENERRNAMGIKEIIKEVRFSEQNTDRKLKDLEKEAGKISGFEESLSVMKEMLAEIRKENEGLRKDRQFLLDKINTLILEKEKVGEKSVQIYDSEKPAVEEEVHAGHVPYADNNSKNKINTSLDTLLELVMKNVSIKIPDAAKKLRVKEKQIEEWAKIMEEHDLIEVHYPVFGKPFLKKKDAKYQK